MKKIIVIILWGFLSAFFLKAQTTIDNGSEVSGTWTKINSPYLINGLATVPTGNTLIIEPGVEIRFKTGVDYYYGDNSVDVGLLYVKGNLIAEGTSSQRITFTRQGDSGNWGCIAFSATADTSSSFKYCKVEYANMISGLESEPYIGALSFKNPKVSISHSEIIANNYHGIYSNHTTFIIQNCIIANNTLRGIYIGYDFNSKDTIIITNNTIVGNGSTGLQANVAKCKIVNNIFWNNSESIYIQSYTSIASYNLVQEDVLIGSSLIIGEGMVYNFDPQLGPDFCPQYNSPVINAGTQDTSGLYLSGYDFLGNNRINQSRIDIGAVESNALKLIWLLSPNGKEGFLAGTNQPIIWKSNVENLKLEYTYDNGSNWVEITGNTPNDGLYNWIIPAVESEYYNIRISDVTDNTFFDLCDDNFVIFTSNIPDSTFLAGRLTIEHSPYYINGLATVPNGDTLTIEPGVEIRFKTGTDYSYSDNKADVGLLYVKGKLVAEGTSNQWITFTRQGDSGNWGCIAFAPTADVSSCLKYCKVEYANIISGLESRSYNGAVSLKNPKISISHSEIINNKSYGIYSDHTTFSIHNCIIANNSGYGIDINYAFKFSDRIDIANNTIVGNGLTGLDVIGYCKIVNNIFWNNGGSFKTSSSYTSNVSYNLVQEDNMIGKASQIGDGMIYNYSPQLGPDFTPQRNSPAINAGAPDTSGLNISNYDILGKNRISLNRVDIGAIESDALKYIWLSAPNGKEGFLPGTAQNIKWKSNVSDIKLEYTDNSGVTWKDIDASTPNDSLFNWIIPPVESESFNIRISDVSDNSVFDVCDDNFIVFTSNIPDSTILTGRLTIDYSPYYINGLATVPSGDTLIIDPGVEIRFKTSDNSALAGILSVKGDLIAEGTSSQRIIFTRQGDTGNWGRISFVATAGTSSSIKYCKVEFAGSGAISIRNPKISISHSEIINNKSYGIYSDHSTFSIYNCIIANNSGYGIDINYAFKSGDIIDIANNTIVGNGLTGLEIIGACKIVNNIFWNNAGSFKTSSSYTSNVSYSLVQEDVLIGSYVKIGEGMIYNLNPQFINSENNDYHLKVTSPGIDAGDPSYIYSMEPSENGGRINIGAYGNTVEAAITESLPRINYLSVNYGRMFGRDTLTIKGTQFFSNRGSGGVIFDNTESTEYLYWTEDSIICITPPHLPGIVNINIINSGDKKGFGENCFSFLPPVLNKPDPIFSNTSGGEQIIFSGELFGHSQNGMQVLFDQIEAPLYHTWKDDTIILNCPSHSEGLTDVIFKVNDSIYYNFNESFLYSDKPLTELCGEISDTLFNSQTYLLTCPVTIPENQTLFIEPGVLIIAQYNEDTLASITANGIIHANGNKSDPIKIISFPQHKGTWEGIILKKQGLFDYCVIKNGINGISVEKGNLELKNSTISNNSNAGLNLDGTNTINVENTSLFDNKYGIYTLAKPGSVSATFSSCNIFDNNESGIYLYSYGYVSGFIVPTYGSSSINFTLKNSVVSNSGSNAIKIRSYGYENSSYSPPAHRYGYVNFISENSIICDNGYGIITQRENTTHCYVNTKFYNTVMYNNNSVIEMDAYSVFIYNSNLWDNGISGMPSGICDSLIIESSNLNSLNNIPYGSNNISENPIYFSPATGNFHLSQGSPCIDEGSNKFVNFETDFDGKVRIWNATDKDRAIVDIGAFEFDSPCYSVTIEKNICEGESYEGHTESGIYLFKYTNVSGCDSVIIVNLHVNPVPGIPTIIQNLDTLTSNVVSGNQWYFNNTAIPGANGQKYITTKSGNYYVVITNNTGCVSSPSNIITVINTSMDNLKEFKLKIYPNPASEIITIEGFQGNEEVEIAIYNLKGNLVKKKITSSKTVQINMEDLEPATYFLILNNQSKQAIKIIKR
ncbi:MAG: right-handed parallel beta-helix repeat-containing protein [Bacteroidales bacterium]|nr:right-handed parallel beta-helix repeat-containing protein [Bacteroidales bacterium]